MLLNFLLNIEKNYNESNFFNFIFLNKILFLIYFSLFTNCTKYICLTKNDHYESYYCNNLNTITNIDESVDISDKILQYLIPSDTAINLKVDSETIPKFQLKIFNYKKILIDLKSAIIDVSGVHGIDASFSSGIYRLIGSSLKDVDTSFYIVDSTIISEVNEIRIKNLTIKYTSKITGKRISANIFYYIGYTNIKVNLTGDNLFLKDLYDYNIYFTGANKTFAINMSKNYQYQQYNLTINNKGTNINFFDFRSIKFITLNGDGFKENNFMKFTRSDDIICNVDCISFAPIEIYTTKAFTINISKSLVIKGVFQPSDSSNFKIDTIDKNAKSRFSVEIEVLKYARIVFIDSSWIDLTINHFIVDYKYEIRPCVGLGGSSSTTLLDAPILDYESLNVNLDIPEAYPTDEYLSLLLSKNWSTLIYKSLDNKMLKEKEIILYFSPQHTHGFKSFYFDNYQTNSILKGKLALTNNNEYVLTFIPSSYSTIPLFLCYTDNNKILSNGKPFNDLALLNELIPIDQKVINLVIDKNATDLDISKIKARDLAFKIKSTKSGSLKSLILDADNINHLIFDTLNFESEVFQLNVKNITFKNITVPPSNIIFDEQATIYTDMTSILNLTTKLDCTFPNTIVYVEQYSGFFGFQPSFSFALYDDIIEICSHSYYMTTQVKHAYNISTINLPKIEFIFFNYGNNLKTQNFYIYNYATSIKSISITPLSSKEYMTINVYLKYFTSIVNANDFTIDLHNFTTKSEINFYGFVWKDWFTIKGKAYDVINENSLKENNFCVCNGDDESCSNFCDLENMVKIGYSEITEKVKTLAEGSVHILVIGTENEIDVPLIHLNYLDNKNVYIYGAGTNPKIKVDISSTFISKWKQITFSEITILSDASKESLFISNLYLKESCIIDDSFKEVSLVTDYLNISILQLSFKSVHVNEQLCVYGDARKTDAKTKVTFSPHAKFNLTIPYSITFNDCMLVIKEIEFNLTQVVPYISVADKRFYPLDKETLLTINAIDANLDVMDGNITFVFTPEFIRVIGNFVNENPSKFILFSYTKLLLQAENIPFTTSLSNANIVLEKEKVSIAGALEFNPEKKDGTIQIYSNIDKKTVFYVKEIVFNTRYDTLIYFNSTLTEMTIDKFEVINPNGHIVFNILFDSNNHNLVQFINEVNIDYNINYKVQFLVPGNIYDQEMLDFIKKNYTLLILNELNTVNNTCINEIKFLSNIIGFSNDNFKLAVQKNKLYLTTIQSPKILLRYGDCSSCVEAEIKDEDINNIEKFYLGQNPVISVTFYESNSPDTYLNFDTNTKIQSLILKSTEFESSFIKLGNSLPDLIAENVSIFIQDSNDFTIQKAKMTKMAKFNDISHYNHLNSLEIDRESLFVSGITEFGNQVDIIIDSLFEINFTSTDVKLVNLESQAFIIEFSKFPHANLLIESGNSPTMNIEEGVSNINKLDSIIFNSSNYSIGFGWNKVSQRIEYTILNEESKNISVITDSFPFNSWYQLFDYPINLTENLSPYTFKDDTLFIHNKHIKINVPNNENITIGEVVMSDNSSVTTNINSSLITNKLTVLNGTSHFNHSIINNEITLGKGSILNGSFTINEELDVLNIEWDLNQAPLINCSLSNETIINRINIIYKGSEIGGRERQFDEFFTKGAVFMINASNVDFLNKVHFISDTVSEFNDGDKLILKCIFAYDKKIIMISTKMFIEEEEEDFDFTTFSIEEVTPTEIPIKEDEPTIGNSFQSTSSMIELTEDGFIDGDNFVQVDDDEIEESINFINTSQKSLTLKAKNNDKQNKELFVSPQIPDTVITILPPSDESNDYKKSSFGIHANSKNPTINLHNEKVPLNIFNDEKSDINFILSKTQRSLNSKISLQNLIISNGDLKMLVPSEIDGIEFNKIESFLNGNIISLNSDQISTEISIETLKMNTGSSIKMSNILLNNTIELRSNSKIEIERKVTFNEQSIISIDESSFIELGKSEIIGICNKIKVNQIQQSKRMINLIKNTVSSEIICGEKFECNEWKEKFEVNSYYKFSQCIQKQNNEMCLVVSNKDPDPKKKKLSAGVIAAIAISVCVVVIAVTVVIILVIKKNSHKDDEQSQEEDNSGIDDYY